jgi:hypothetical protein
LSAQTKLMPLRYKLQVLIFKLLEASYSVLLLLTCRVCKENERMKVDELADKQPKQPGINSDFEKS